MLRKGLFLMLVVVSCALPKWRNKDINTKADLGKKLFFDPILSKDKSISCASCHKPQFAFADNKKFSLGVHDSLGIRNTPSIMNMASRESFFWDGRKSSLEEQLIVPIESAIEMNLPFGMAVKRIQKNKAYRKLFLKVYQELPNEKNIPNAIASFERSLESDGSAPHDQWVGDIDTNAFTPSQIRGRDLFLEKAKCFDCHFGPDFTGDEFKNIGLFDGVKLKDKGRYEVTQKQEDLGKFKVPGLRNVSLTAPYMHNGMFKTLEEVVDYYSNPYEVVKNPVNIDTLLVKPLNLNEQEKKDLVAFLKGLEDKNIPLIKEQGQ